MYTIPINSTSIYQSLNKPGLELFLSHSHRFRPKCLRVVEPPWELSTGILKVTGEMTSPARFCMDTSGRQTSPQFLFKSPQKDNIPLHGRRWNAIGKTLLWRSAHSFLSCPMDLVHKSYFSKGLRSPNSKHRGMWKSSKVCTPNYSRWTAASSTVKHTRKTHHACQECPRQPQKNTWCSETHCIILAIS